MLKETQCLDDAEENGLPEVQRYHQEGKHGKLVLNFVGVIKQKDMIDLEDAEFQDVEEYSESCEYFEITIRFVNLSRSKFKTNAGTNCLFKPSWNLIKKRLNS